MPSGPIYPEHRLFESKSWGWEETIFNGKYCGKIIFIKSSKKTEFIYHKIKDKTIYVQSGMVDLSYSEDDNIIKTKKHLLNTGDAFRIKHGIRYSLEAVGDVYLYEMSTQHKDDDVYKSDINN